MRVFFIVLLALISGTANSQNAFYNTHKLSNWRDSILILGENPDKLPDEEIGKRKSAFIDSINATIFYYAGEKSWEKFLQYPAMRELYDTIYSQLLGIKELRTLFLNGQLKGFPEISNLLDSLDGLTGQLKQKNQFIAEKKLLLDLKRDTIRLLTTDPGGINLSTINNLRTIRILPTEIAGRRDTTAIATSIDQQSDRLKTELAALEENIRKAGDSAKTIEDEISAIQQSIQTKTNTPTFKEALVKLKDNSQVKRIMAGYNAVTIDMSGEGYNANTRTNFEKNNISALQQKNDALPALKNFSLPGQSDLIDGLAIYLARRVKQEMVLAFTDQLKKSLVTDSLLSTFFPETKRLFTSLPDYEFSRFGAAWRYAISKDFVQLPDNFFRSSFAKLKINNTNLYNYQCFHDVYYMADLIRKKYNFLEMIEELSTRELTGDANLVLQTKEIRQFVNITHVLNKELFSQGSNKQYWISSDAWSSFSPEEFQLFWALVNVKYPLLTEFIQFKREDNKYKLSDATYRSLNLWVKRILFALNKFQGDQQELYTKIDSDNANWEYRITNYWNNVEDIINMVINNDLVNQEYKSSLSQTMMTIDRLFNVYEAIQQKNYVSAIEETLGMVEVFVKEPQVLDGKRWHLVLDSKTVRVDGKSAAEYLDETYDSIYLNGEKKSPSGFLFRLADSAIAVEDIASVTKYNRILNEMSQRDVIFKGIILDKEGFLKLTNENPLYAQLFNKNNTLNIATARKAASIFQDILLARKSEELSQVIEKYALPPGSYKIKRRSRMSFDLNAYFGIYSGQEWVQSETGKYSWGNSGTVVGLTAPIGFSVSWAGYTEGKKGDTYVIKKALKKYKGTSHTISLSIIDIAAVVSYRLTNAADKPLPSKVTWGQVISPGIFYRYGIRNTPMCLHLGVQLSPQLRTIGDTKNLNTFRISSGVTMDLPLINLGKKF